MDRVLQALDDTRDFLEAKFDAALDAGDLEMADAYRYSLKEFQKAILAAGFTRSMRYLSDWALRNFDRPKRCEECGSLLPDVGPCGRCQHKEGLFIRRPPCPRSSGSEANSNCKLRADHPGDCDFETG